jgi:hypothetical protein
MVILQEITEHPLNFVTTDYLLRSHFKVVPVYYIKVVS